MNQRGSVVLYFLFSIVVSIAVGVGVYSWMRENKGMFESKNDDSTQSASTKPPTVTKKAQPVNEPPAVVEYAEAVPVEDPVPENQSIAESRAVDPVVVIDSDDTPVFGVPGIDGGIERGSVERRFKPRGPMLQRCFDDSDGSINRLRVTMNVQPNGKVALVTLNDGWDAAFQECAISALNFTYSPTRDGKPATIVMPLAFRRSAR
jgi:hypothetical protein